MRTTSFSSTEALENEAHRGMPHGHEEAAKIMHDGVASLQGFGDLQLSTQNPDGSIDIVFTDCAFAEFVHESGQPCGSQAICYFGFGMVEETLRRLMGQRVMVKLLERDDGCGVCREVAIPR